MTACQSPLDRLASFSPVSFADVAVGAPLNGMVEVAGPQQFRFDEQIRQGLAARNDSRAVVIDPHAMYFGAELGERSLVPAGQARLGEIRFEEWLVAAGPG